MKKLFLLIPLLLLLCSCKENAGVSLDNSSGYKSSLNSNVSDEYDYLNNKNQLYPSTCCYIEETDTLFFSDGKKLYQKNGDEINVLAEINASSIIFIDGWLYFVSPVQKLGHEKVGNVYKYNPETSETVLVLECNGKHIARDGEKLEVETITAEKNNDDYVYVIQYYECGLQGENPVKMEYMSSKVFDGGRSVLCEYDKENKMFSYNLYEGENCKQITSGKKYSDYYNFSFYDNYIYWLSHGFYDDGYLKIMRYDTLTGETTGLRISERAYDYTILNDKIYLYTTDFYILDMDMNILEKCTYDGVRYYNTVYSFGGEIYAGCHNITYKIKFDGDTYNHERLIGGE